MKPNTRQPNKLSIQLESRRSGILGPVTSTASILT